MKKLIGLTLVVASCLFSQQYHGVTTGTAQNQIVSLSPPIKLTTIPTWAHLSWIATTANTTSDPVLSLGASIAGSTYYIMKTIKKCGTSSLVAGDIAVGVLTNAIYDGTYWQLQNPQVGACASSVTQAVVSNVYSTTAGSATVGTASHPFGSLILGAAATNVFTVTGTATGPRTITLPDASITVPGTRGYNGGTTSTYTPVNISPTTIIHSGSAALVSTGSTSPVTIATFSPAFTSATSYVCTVTPQGSSAAVAAGGVAVTQSSGSQIIIYGPASQSTVVNYICIGN